MTKVRDIGFTCLGASEGSYRFKFVTPGAVETRRKLTSE